MARTTDPENPALDVAVASTRSWRVCGWIAHHPVLSVLLAAMTVRVVVAIALWAFGLVGDVASDSDLYLRLARHYAGYDVRGFGVKFQDTGSFGAYLVPVTTLFKIFGPHVLLAQLVAVAFGAVAAAIVTRLALALVPPWWAIGAGAVVAFYPSLVLWSSVPLRDSVVWATAATMALTIVFFSRARSIDAFGVLGLALGGLLFVLGHVRPTEMCIAAIALVLRALVAPSRYRVATIVVAVVLALTVPWIVGWGPGGIDRIRGNDLTEIRVDNTEGAESALDVPERSDDAGIVTDLGYLPRGLVVILAEPLPWTSLQGETVILGRVQSPLWWLLVLTSLTAVPLLWRRRRELAFPALYVVGLVFVLAIAEGNFGTAFRHRDGLIWALALLSGAGLHRLVERRRAPRVASPSAPQ